MNTQYVVKRGVLKMPRAAGSKDKQFSVSVDMVRQGELLPEGVFTKDDIAGWLRDGRIAVLGAVDGPAASAVLPQRKSKWCVDPVSLVRKDMETLMAMILEIDEDYDFAGIKSEEDAIRQLSQDWNPAFAAPVAVATDKTDPALQRLTGRTREAGSGLKDAGSPELSREASKVLDQARLQAQAAEAEQPAQTASQKKD